MSIPHLFRCPISLDLFTDPVTLSTGQTYDRPSIEKWLAAGNDTCPVTMQRLTDTGLVPNRTLRHLIDRWLLSGSDPYEFRPEPNILAQATGTGTALSLTSLKHSLQSHVTDIDTKFQILKKVRILAVESDIGNACLIQLGFFPLLLQLVFQSSSSEFSEVGLDCVTSLLHSAQLDSLNMLKKEANLTSLLLLLDQGNVKIKTSLCYLIETITTSDATRELCQVLGKSPRVLQIVLSLVHRCSEPAVRALSGICSVEANIFNAIQGGAIDGLISYLMNSSTKNSSIALATLETLANTEPGKRALIKSCNGVRVLVKSVFRVSSESGGSEHAIGALMVVCRESAKARAEAVEAGVMSQVLLLLQSQCGCKGKAKARGLLKLFRSMWGRDPSTGARFYPVF
ncbi:uncharacterized protein A4U43_C02F6390 [Asparagus officinalis]|uniref:U-box domain-containing protein n=1 Tax=Asparagus officinalis TaxID=4686 RepID=A0A5P1FGC2_ASPOF|nr:U-box domain-containing protein 26-like [Asparagus officinalis]ONK77425.1 uncharacterized protein A4U43_C02F6390 [Asparagus officinalis]